jgi:hypothetical protein
MDIRLDEAQETELNMTPMIDIVFQLIIFFLLSLKFKTIDRRIDSMLPKDRGPNQVPAFPKDFQKVRVKVFRRDVQDAHKAATVVRIDNDRRVFALPAGWRGRGAETPERVRRYDATIAAIRSVIAAKRAAHGPDAAKVKGEIVAPPPRGGLVPDGDVIRILDTFLSLGMTDVVFEGQSTPLSSRERALRRHDR